MEELIHASEGAYKRRDLYLRGPINGGTYICKGLQQEQKKHLKHAIAVLIKIQFALTWFLSSCQISFQYIWNRSYGGGGGVGVIRNFHISHNAPYLPPNILHNLCFSFLLSIIAISREIENNAQVKFEGLVRCIMGNVKWHIVGCIFLQMGL